MPPPGTTFIVTAAPGIFGNLIAFNLVGLPGGANYASSVSGFAITITVGTSGSNTNVDWAAIAAAFNADASVSLLASMDGASGDFSTPSALPNGGSGILKGGGSGIGLGQYYNAAPPPALTGWLPQFKGRVNAA